MGGRWAAAAVVKWPLLPDLGVYSSVSAGGYPVSSVLGGGQCPLDTLLTGFRLQWRLSVALTDLCPPTAECPTRN